MRGGSISSRLRTNIKTKEKRSMGWRVQFSPQITPHESRDMRREGGVACVLCCALLGCQVSGLLRFPHSRLAIVIFGIQRCAGLKGWCFWSGCLMSPAADRQTGESIDDVGENGRHCFLGTYIIPLLLIPISASCRDTLFRESLCSSLDRTNPVRT
jgi:hypothetical protein